MSKYEINKMDSVGDIIDYCRILKNNDFCSKNSNFINRRILNLVGYKTLKNYDYDLIYLYLSKISRNADIYSSDPDYLNVHNEEIYKQLIHELKTQVTSSKLVKQKTEVISFLEYNNFKIDLNNKLKLNKLVLNKSSGNTPTKLIKASAISNLAIFSQLDKSLSKISESPPIKSADSLARRSTLNKGDSLARRSTLNKTS